MEHTIHKQWNPSMVTQASSICAHSDPTSTCLVTDTSTVTVTATATELLSCESCIQMQSSNSDDVQIAWIIVALLMTALAIATTSISFVMGCLLYRKLPQIKSCKIIKRNGMQTQHMVPFYLYVCFFCSISFSSRFKIKCSTSSK